MYSDQQPYRQLHDDLLGYEGDAPYPDLLRPWLQANDGERRWLEAIGRRTGSPVPAATPEELCRLYALSRIVELLNLSFAPRSATNTRNLVPVGPDEYAAFMEGLGLERIGRPDFHPFHHEIVAVDEAADEDARPSVAETYWPGWMLGPLLIGRAGCRVAAGRRHVRREIAEQSTLYWAYARNNRPTADLSNGWGGNSQWRTPFRRDYALDGALRYNVDARVGPQGIMESKLDAAERAELLRHRCFVACAKPGDDRWPYDLTLVENA